MTYQIINISEIEPLRFKAGDRVMFNNEMLGPNFYWPGTIAEVRDSISYDLWLDGKEQPIIAYDKNLMDPEEAKLVLATRGIS